MTTTLTLTYEELALLKAGLAEHRIALKATATAESAEAYRELTEASLALTEKLTAAQMAVKA